MKKQSSGVCQHYTVLHVYITQSMMGTSVSKKQNILMSNKDPRSGNLENCFVLHYQYICLTVDHPINMVLIFLEH